MLNDDHVAVKMLDQDQSMPKEVLDSFKKEIRVATSLANKYHNQLRITNQLLLIGE